MNKYIDVELLREEINKKIIDREKELKSFSDEDYICSVASDIACRKRGYLDIIELLDSLQQKQEQHVIGGQVFGATDVEQLYEGKVYIISNLVQDIEFGIKPHEQVKMLLIKD